MTYQDIDGLMKGMQSKNILLQEKTEEYLKLAEKRAVAERDHHVAVAKATLTLKDAGNSITLIRDLILGRLLIRIGRYSHSKKQNLSDPEMCNFYNIALSGMAEMAEMTVEDLVALAKSKMRPK
jgi:hypothetical protein